MRVKNKGTLCSIAGCENPSKYRGWCNRHYLKWQRYGDPLEERHTPHDGRILQWLSEHISHCDDKCLTWPFARIENGYGMVYIDGKVRNAARVMCELVHGKPPESKYVARHLCNKGHFGCVNPKHLIWGTKAQDVADAIAHGTFVRGEINGNSKLTRTKVHQIRVHKGNNTSIAKEFRISRAQVRRIRNRVDWAWLE